MALPARNTTCDIFRATTLPPDPPEVAGVPCFLLPKGRSTLTTPHYTHVLLVGPEVDIRDHYAPGSLGYGATADKVFLPDASSPVTFRVVLVRRVGRGTAADHKECLLVREFITWPTNEV
jgi:hypothetical protein